MEIVRQQMPKAFGLQSYSPVILCAAEMDAIRQAVDSSCRPWFDAAFLQKQVVSFRIRAKRSDKTFPLRSQQIEIELATMICNIYGNDKLEIDLNHGEVTVGCEVRDEFAFHLLRQFFRARADCRWGPIRRFWRCCPEESIRRWRAI